MTGFKPGDRIRVVLEGQFLDDDGDRCVVLSHHEALGIPDTAVVELIEAADDPSKDPFDTVRRGPNGAIAVCMHVTRNSDDYRRGWRLTRGSAELTDTQVAGWERVGVVPGTPAAESDVPMGNAEARETCTLDDCVAAPRCSSGATVWHTKTDECGPQQRELRVFQSDGPEPPSDVKVLEWLVAREPTQWRFLHRVGDGWLWSNDGAAPDRHGATPNTWSGAVFMCAGQYREVRP